MELKQYNDVELMELKEKIKIEEFEKNIFPKIISQEERVNIFDDLIEKINYMKDIEIAEEMLRIPFFKNLTKEEASSVNLWSTLCVEYFSEYVYKRWFKNKKLTEDLILTRSFAKGKLLYNRNAMARLWWITKLTYDENLEDKLLYTRILLERSQFEQSIMESSLAKNEIILKKIMKSIIRYEEANCTMSANEIKEYMMLLNRLGGTYILDIMDEEYFYEKLEEVMK